MLSGDLIAGRYRLVEQIGIAVWANLTETGAGRTSPGTPGYLAPEVLAGGMTSPASDMYALGVALSTAVEGGAEPETGTGDDRRASWFGIVLSALTHTSPRRRPSALRAKEMLLEVATGERTARRSVRRPLLLVAGALLLVAATVATVLWWPSPQAAPASYIGDPRTIDPCGLVDKTPLTRFGTVRRQDDFGEFNRCDLVLTPAAGNRGGKTVQLWVTGALEACSLIRQEDLDRVLGKGKREPDGVGTANWGCHWSGVGPVTGVRLKFVRDHPPHDGDYGRRIEVAGRMAAVDDTGDFGGGDCVIRVVHRPYASNGPEGTDGVPKTEQFRLHLRGNGTIPMSERCRLVEQLAEAAANRLPR